MDAAASEDSCSSELPLKSWRPTDSCSDRPIGRTLGTTQASAALLGDLRGRVSRRLGLFGGTGGEDGLVGDGCQHLG